MNARMLTGVRCFCSLILVGYCGCQTDQSNKMFGSRHTDRAARAQTPDADHVPETPSPEILPQTHLSAGKLHESQGHLARAVDQYRQVLAIQPDNLEAANRLGIVLDRLGRFKEADEIFTRAIKKAPNEAYLHNNLAFSYIMQTRWKDAQAELTQALELRPDFGRARVNLGMVLAQQEQFEAAQAQFEIALSQEDAYYNMGLMYQSKRRLADAAVAFKKALQHNPKLVAAQKRLDALPPDVVNAVKEESAVTASPPPVKPAVGPASEKPRPAGIAGTQPSVAKEPAPVKPAEPIKPPVSIAAPQKTPIQPVATRPSQAVANKPVELTAPPPAQAATPPKQAVPPAPRLTLADARAKASQAKPKPAATKPSQAVAAATKAKPVTPRPTLTKAQPAEPKPVTTKPSRQTADINKPPVFPPRQAIAVPQPVYPPLDDQWWETHDPLGMPLDPADRVVKAKDQPANPPADCAQTDEFDVRQHIVKVWRSLATSSPRLAKPLSFGFDGFRLPKANTQVSDSTWRDKTGAASPYPPFGPELPDETTRARTPR